MITRVCWFFTLCCGVLLLAPPSPALAQDQVSVVIEDPDDVLTPAQEEGLSTWTQDAGLDPTVDTVTFLLWRQASEPFNDFVVNTAKASYPQLIAEDGRTWSDGDLIFALATDSRLTGSYAGEDINAAVGFQSNLQSYHDQMTPALREGNWQAGLEAGVTAVANSQPPAPAEPADPVAVGVGTGVALAGVAGITTLALRRVNRKQTQRARELYQVLGSRYGDLASRLDEIDIRANSLNNPLVDAKLREEWAQIRDGFVAAHQQMSALEHLESGGDAQLRKALPQLKAINAAFDKLSAAEDNIDTLFRMEQGDTATRQQELTHLHQDLLAATMKVKNQAHASAIAALDERCMALYNDPGNPRLLEEYSLIVADYATIMDVVNKEELDNVAKKKEVPSLSSRDWHPGYGYNNFVPFVLANTWHQEAIASASTSSTVNTSYSGGFSGAGGSSRF